MAIIKANMLVFDEIDWIPYSLGAIYDVVDEIYIVDGAFIGYSDHHRSCDGTIEFIREFDKDKKIHLFLGDDFWGNFEQKKSFCERFYNPGDWIFIVDADEVHKSKDIIRVRSLIDEMPHICEFVPVFKHFGVDFYHIGRPHNPGCNITHQRFIKWHEGYTFGIHHPTCSDNRKRDTCWSDDYRPYRHVIQDWYIYHLTWCKASERLFNKTFWLSYYLLGKSEKAAREEANALISTHFQNAPQFLLEHDENELPEILRSHPMWGKHIFASQCDHWLSVPEYGQKIVPSLYERDWPKHG